MDTIKISYDQQSFKAKPSGDEIRWINNRIARSVKKLNHDELKRVITRIGSEGCTFSPATFKNGKRNKDNFEQQQLFALDFDNKDPKKKLAFDEVKERADQYGLPILFAYDTMSSMDHDKFRVVFLNDASVTDRRAAEAMQLAMGKMFPEADPSCYKDVSKLYFGGKEILYYDDKMPEINIESIFRNYTYCMRKRYRDNHYKEHIAKFSKETGIALTKKGLLDITVADHLPEPDDPTEDSGASQYIKNGKNSPLAIISHQDKFNIKADGEIFPNKYYVINFAIDGTRSSSVKTPDKKSGNHNEYRSGVLQEMNKCRLFHEFASGDRKLSHDELFGIATNLIQIETGKKYFMKKILEYPELYTDDVKNGKWEKDFSYMRDYHARSCDNYCPYKEECIHCKNILETVHPKRGSMEKVIGYHEEFVSMEEMQDDVYDAISNAFYSNGKKFNVIKAQVGGGKSYSYLKLMQENQDTRFIIAVPTNLLKGEIFGKAKELDIKVMMTPSLEAIKDEIPDKIWEHIQKLYKRGQYSSVHRYIEKCLKKKDIPCLKHYMKRREKLKAFHGCVITTHRYLLSMDKEKLDEFDTIIIDEDILFKSVISNQEEISVSKLEKLKKKTTDPQLKEKAKELLQAAKTQACIETEGFEWEEDEGDKPPIAFDLPAFCRAKRFYLRKAENEKNLKEVPLPF